MVCAKVNQIIAAMTASCLSPGELAAKAGVGVNTVYRMRYSRTSGRLRPYLDDVIYNMALHGNGVERFNRTWTSSTERVALRLAE